MTALPRNDDGNGCSQFVCDHGHEARLILSLRPFLHHFLGFGGQALAVDLTDAQEHPEFKKQQVDREAKALALRNVREIGAASLKQPGQEKLLTVT